MAYNGWLRLGGVEVVNDERLATYLDNGIAPLDAQVNVEPCEGLSEVLSTDWSPFRTPMQDEAPWYDEDDPDTWDFAGLLVTELTGLDDTTRTLEMATTLAGTGVAGRATRTPRTVGGTAVLVGRTTEACQAGLAWLRRVLHGACDADEQPVTSGDTLEFLTACPTPLAPTADTSMSPEVKYLLTDPGTWRVQNGTITPTDNDTVIFRPFDSAAVLDGGDAGPDEDGVVDGGGAEPAEGLYEGGTVSGVYRPAYLSGEPQAGCLPGPVTITWTLRGSDPGTVVQGALVNAAGAVTEYGPKWDLSDDPFPAPLGDFTDFEVTWDLPFGIDYDVWAPAIISSDEVEVLTVEVSGHPVLSVDACLNPLRRTLPGVVCTSGPNPVDSIDTGCEVLLVVEWVWVSRSPYRYSPPAVLLTGLANGVAPSYTAPGVSYDEGGGTVVATPWNCSPAAAPASCAIDPSTPTFGTPPALPAVVEARRPRITTQPVRSVWALIGPEQIPANEGTLTITLTAPSGPVVGSRVRVYDNADADGTVPDNCDFAYEFLIDYVPGGGVMTIEADSITTVCAGYTVPEDASAGVRGAYGGPIEPPVVRCNRRYLVLVQSLDTYPSTATGFYTFGASEGPLSVDLAVSSREG